MINILSWNILADEYVAPAAENYPNTNIALLDRSARIERVLATLRDYSDCELILLQEVMPEEADSISTLLADHIVVRGPPISWYGSVGKSGNLTAVRRDVGRVVIEHDDVCDFCTDGAMFFTTIVIRNRLLSVVNTHLDDGDDDDVRRVQMKTILMSNPDIIGGDFNQDWRPQERCGNGSVDIYETLFAAGYVLQNVKPTYFFQSPPACIDQIATRMFDVVSQGTDAFVHSHDCANFCDVSANNILYTVGSDHLPVHATLRHREQFQQVL